MRWIFASSSSVILACDFLFLWCLWCCYQGDAVLLGWVESEVFLPLQFFGMVWERFVLTLLQMFGRIHLWSHWVLDFGLLEFFFITDYVSLLVVGLFIFSILPGSVLGDFTFLGVCPFLPGCPFYQYLDIIVCSDLIWPLYFCSVDCNFSFFISNFIYLSPPSFFLDESAHVYVLKGVICIQ